MFVKRFWLVTDPFFKSRLIIGNVPPSFLQEAFLQEEESEDENAAPATRDCQLSFYSPSGELFNKAQVRIGESRVTSVDLHQFMATLKPDSGFRHASLVVEHPESMHVQCRLENIASWSILGGLQICNRKDSFFAPVHLGAGMKSLLSIVNTSDDSADVKIRFIQRKRSPERLLSFRPHEIKVLGLDTEFASGGSTGLAYVRLATSAAVDFGVQVVQQRLGDQQEQSLSTLL